MDNPFPVLHDYALYQFCRSIAFHPVPFQVFFCHREHLGIVETMAMPRARLFPWRKREIMALWRRRRDVGAQRDCKIIMMAFIDQTEDKHIRTPVLQHYFPVPGISVKQGCFYCDKPQFDYPFKKDPPERVLTRERYSALCSTPSLSAAKRTSPSYSDRDGRSPIQAENIIA